MKMLSAVILIFLVLDPFGNIPLFMSILKKSDYRSRKKIISRELLIALLVLIVFLFTGRYILNLLDISEPSLSIAGGIILFMIALKMIFIGSENIFGDTPDGDPLIFPLAVPFVAGPSAIATILLLMAREPTRWLEWLTALIMAWFFSGIIIIFSDSISNIVGNKVLTAFERLMGMLLTMVAVEIFIKGVKQLPFLH